MIGIPTIEQYETAIKSKNFAELEEFSDSFLKNNVKLMNEKWISDPLHQWSRQWEYPYVLAKIQEFQSKTDQLRILDAGSGLTFFPYYLAKKFPKSTIICCDYDSKLIDRFKKINDSNAGKISFDRVDLHELPYEDEFFDLIYCISVMEHTDNYGQILKEFKRVLKPNGMFVISFDISIDGDRNLPVNKAKIFLEKLNEIFTSTERLEVTIDDAIKKNNILTTRYAKTIDEKLIPWKPTKIQKLKSLVKKRKRDADFFNLTCFTGNFVNN